MSSVSSVALPQQRTSLIALKAAVAAFAVTSAALAALYYQASRELETERATVASLQLEIAREVAHAAELKSDLNAARSDAQALTHRSAQLSSEVQNKDKALAVEKSKAESAQAALEQEKARLPAMPLRIEMRRSAVGRGLVAMMTNTSALHLQVVMTAFNPTTGAQIDRSFQIAPGKKVEFGHLEGIQFASGDQVSLRSAGFEEIHYVVP
jgi:septal ring factor EnvC (AmiA/AmiB activator)